MEKDNSLELLKNPSEILAELKKIKKLGKEKGEKEFKKYSKKIHTKYILGYEPNIEFYVDSEKLIPTDEYSTYCILDELFEVGHIRTFNDIDCFINGLQTIIKNKKLPHNKRITPEITKETIYADLSNVECFDDEVLKASKSRKSAFKKLEDELYKNNNSLAIIKKISHTLRKVKGFELSKKEFLEAVKKCVYECGDIEEIGFIACAKSDIKYSKEMLTYYLLYLSLIKNSENIYYNDVLKIVAEFFEKGMGVVKSKKIADKYNKNIVR